MKKDYFSLRASNYNKESEHTKLAHSLGAVSGMMMSKPRVLIVAEHASLKFGGEAALPLHYFRILRQRSIESWLIVHERTRNELSALFPNDLERIYFVSDTFWHIRLWQLGKLMPKRLSDFTFGFIMRLLTQVVQRRIAKQVVEEQKIDVIHQPIPVSPKEPSSIFNLGVPVIIGPMNGGMNYPAGFRQRQNHFVSQTLAVGRSFANLMNRLIPGKRQATVLLVANERTKEALPASVCHNKIVELVENGIDLNTWHQSQSKLSEIAKINSVQVEQGRCHQPIRFVFIGRLVDWKAVDLLLIAFKQVAEQLPVELEIIGDGPEKSFLEQQAHHLGLNQSRSEDNSSAKAVRFRGWLTQADCAQRLQSANALVLPSLLECGGAVVLEAMAMGIPVIASNWGGPADYVDETCGILVEPSSQELFIKGLTEAMFRLASQPELGQKMGQAGYQRVLNCFDWEKKVDTMIDIYQESIEKYASL